MYSALGAEEPLGDREVSLFSSLIYASPRTLLWFILLKFQPQVQTMSWCQFQILKERSSLEGAALSTPIQSVKVRGLQSMKI